MVLDKNEVFLSVKYADAFDVLCLFCLEAFYNNVII